MTGTLRPLTLLVLCLSGLVQNLPAFWTGGHAIVARGAAGGLPDEMPAFFRQGGDALADFAAEPDRWKNLAAPHLRNAEWPNHFVDYELVEGQPLPPLRWQFATLCGKLRKAPDEIGFLPYSLVEETERLTLAFSDYRRRPDGAEARQKCLLYGGILSHYAADLAQPLHLTIDYDGRTRPGAPSPRTGIHNRMDALIQAAQIRPDEIRPTLAGTLSDDLFTSAVQMVALNRRHIARVYALENELPVVQKAGGVEAGWQPSGRVRQFALDRARAAASLTADCWLTAWRHSIRIEPHTH